jgi:hypothetical protein
MSEHKMPSISDEPGSDDVNIEDVDPEDIVSTDNDDLNEAFGFNEAGAIDDEEDDDNSEE